MSYRNSPMAEPETIEFIQSHGYSLDGVTEEQFTRLFSALDQACVDWDNGDRHADTRDEQAAAYLEGTWDELKLDDIQRLGRAGLRDQMKL
tara:strand:+ start:198 stop:470 length:273 start_codon:yes stop_codon:yes gene_type:complete